MLWTWRVTSKHVYQFLLGCSDAHWVQRQSLFNVSTGKWKASYILISKWMTSTLSCLSITLLLHLYRIRFPFYSCDVFLPTFTSLSAVLTYNMLLSINCRCTSSTFHSFILPLMWNLSVHQRKNIDLLAGIDPTTPRFTIMLTCMVTNWTF